MQLKKLTHILLVLLLLLSTAGVSINKHYSGGDLFSTALFVEADSCCENPCGCCDESTETIKIESDYMASIFDDLTEVAQLDLLYASIHVWLQLVDVDNSTSSPLIGDTSPPLPDLCILNQVFRL